MRLLKEREDERLGRYPVRIAEIVEHLEELLQKAKSEMGIGDMRPLLLTEAIRIVKESAAKETNP